MSAIREEDSPLLKVLFVLFPKFNTLDVAGPLEVLNWASHKVGDPGKKSLVTVFISS